ncbi:RluA family pseudouridine synthase [Ornithobacterium rhinotracheale]|uniref:Pseudouridine synthase n=1 Tax=Ornithobacterium rhinotracheale (strain ATCC 51463 / DSM 15997 / CCUG 23171 / CIP 104009 / LMG 9086) TaxID=867902 RepID=I4A0V5_ORNRL|nr:RluA family pseudouridine synthase [Ornithobacterium rhinotracheale]AFL97589.1 ribosomal large subunit pseudouridine synthase D [Ornithobacterium rhinotracheale DSM 15997]AIP98895.1 ribosomal large subunit pseudouridine synthase D [Ornithobacterium rhinotracheale ORT-UMN 88]KGB66851.1 ribosomal large subunit pseudouridine synthase D [Ornithobacterium rhinotracheale H06-030791]MBN3661860.1 RluA family pseudouridine synthase [Ornithobacterium rhinotracheale]MCK0194980.1 RluA family pseudourid
MKEHQEAYEPTEEEDELYEHYRFTADKGQQPLRVDKFLMNFIENATRNKIQQAAKAGNILVNDEAVKQNYRVKAGDEVKVVLSYPPRENVIIPQNIPVDIVYEDESVIVVNKAPGMVVHPGHGNYSGTLVNALKYHFDNLPSLTAELERPGLVHRIDKDTSGLLVIAKTEYAMDHLAKQFFNRTTRRLYTAIVWGNIEEDEGTIVGHIGRNPNNRMQMAVFEDGSQGKHAVTHFKVLERLGYITVVQCKLETGRTHQIRAHMKHIGHTLFNDERYGGDEILKGTTFTKYKQFVQNCFQVCPRQALHAQTLGFEHPVTGEQLDFESPVPEDMTQLLEKWRTYSNATWDED